MATGRGTHAHQALEAKQAEILISQVRATQLLDFGWISRISYGTGSAVQLHGGPHRPSGRQDPASQIAQTHETRHESGAAATRGNANGMPIRSRRLRARLAAGGTRSGSSSSVDACQGVPAGDAGLSPSTDGSGHWPEPSVTTPSPIFGPATTPHPVSVHADRSIP